MTPLLTTTCTPARTDRVPELVRVDAATVLADAIGVGHPPGGASGWWARPVYGPELNYAEVRDRVRVSLRQVAAVLAAASSGPGPVVRLGGVGACVDSLVAIWHTRVEVVRGDGVVVGFTTTGTWPTLTDTAWAGGPRRCALEGPQPDRVAAWLLATAAAAVAKVLPDAVVVPDAPTVCEPRVRSGAGWVLDAGGWVRADGAAGALPDPRYRRRPVS